LAYFGVLDPARFLPDKCLFAAGIGVCNEFTVLSNSNMIITLTNNLGVPVSFSTNGTITANGLSTACTPVMNVSFVSGNINATPTLAGTWNVSQLIYINLSGCSILSGERPTVKITLDLLPTGKVYFNISGCSILDGERPTVKITLDLLPTGKAYSKAYEGELSAKKSS
jgi:hypothetical protein